jgi:hypothetical protein
MTRLKRYNGLASRITDKPARDAIAALVVELEHQKLELHPAAITEVRRRPLGR